MNTVIIPTYCEQDNIAELKRRLPRDTKVLIVDDSPDEGTAQAARNAGFEVLRRKDKRGLSSAVIDGIASSNSDKVIVMDADLQHPPELVQKLFEELETHDFVAASRYTKDGSCEGWTLKRRIISRVANLLALPLTGVKDAASGFFGFRRSGLPNLKGVNDRGFKIMLELLVRGSWGSVAEVPYTFVPRQHGQTKMRWTQIRDYLFQLVSLYLHKFRILKFMLVGAFGTIVNLTTLYLVETFILHKAFATSASATLTSHTYLIAFIPAIMLSIISNYTLNSLWTFKDRKAGRVGFPKYFLVAIVTLPLSEALLFVFTDWCGIWYIFSAALAILIVFLIRYKAADKFVWSRMKA